MKEVELGELFFVFGKVTSSKMILQKSASYRISNGTVPFKSSNVKIPKLQISTLISYPFCFRISGEKYKGVPQKVYLSSYPSTDQPKSQIFIMFYAINQEYHLIKNIFQL